MRFIASTPVIILVAVYISGCAPRTLNPGSEKVTIRFYSPAVVKNCKFMGEIFSESIHRDLSLTSSQQEMELDDINFLKNEGKKLGANTVTVLRHDQVISERKRYGKHKFMGNKLSVTYEIQGRAYSCPSTVIQSLQSVGSGYFQHQKRAKN